MPVNPVISVAEHDLSRGIDQRSAESDIPEGYVEDLLNGEVIETRLRKRKGLQGVAGNLPVRATGIEYLSGTTDNILVTLPDGIDLSGTPTSPIIMYGRTSSNPSDTDEFSTTDSVHYYAKWRAYLRKALTGDASPHTLTVSAGEHAQGTPFILTGVAASLDPVTTSWSSVLLDSISVNQSTNDISLGYTTSTSQDVFVYYLGRAQNAGTTYVGSAVSQGATWAVSAGTTSTISISASQHQLSNFQIIARIFQSTGGSYVQITPDSLTISSSTGAVGVTVTNNTSGTINLIAVLSVVDTANLTSGTINAGATSSITVSTLTSPWIFPAVYEVSGATLTEITPDSLSYDSSTGNLTIQITNRSAGDLLCRIYWTYGVTRANQLTVTSNEDVSGAAGFSDTTPQITIWGLDHSEIYSTSSAREGWTTHLDSYRRSGEQRLVAGLGGQLYTSRSYAESGTSHDYALLQINLNGRLTSNTTIAPLLHDTGVQAGRTRGYITSSSSATGWGTVTAVNWISGTHTRYTVSLPNMAFWDSSNGSLTLTQGNLDSMLSYTEADQLTVEGMAWASQNGTFTIIGTEIGTDSVSFTVINESITSPDFDDAGCAGLAAVLTDLIPLTVAASYFLPGDTVTYDSASTSVLLEVVAATASTILVSGVTDTLTLPQGLEFLGSRTSSIVPLRDATTTDITGLLRGDMVAYSDNTNSRLMRVLGVQADTTARSLTLTGDGTTTTCTMGSGDTSYLGMGLQIILAYAGSYSGTYTIQDIISSTEFTILSSLNGSATAQLVPATAQLDETINFSDDSGNANYLEVTQRWIPVEAPDDNYTLTPSTHIRTLDAATYTDQPFLRSVMVADNMYLTNAADEVQKFEGSSVYRAGLIPWQPGLFLTQDTGASAKIVSQEPRSAITSISSNSTTEFKVTTYGEQARYAVGDRVYYFAGTGGSPAGSGTYVVTKVRDDGTNGFVELDTGLTAITLGSSGYYLKKVAGYRYYFRLNAVDSNDNIVASAIAQSQDYRAELIDTAAIYLRLVGLPPLGTYDFDTLEVEIYRTKVNTPAPFYRLTTIKLPFDAGTGYIDFTDSYQDSDLLELDVTSGLTGGELGTGWQEPLRAKYLTTAGNSLVLGNIKDYPQIDLQITNTASVASNSNFSGAKYLIRRDDTDTGTTTNMVDRVTYEFVTSGAVTITPATDIANNSGTSFTVTKVTHGLVAGNWVYLYHASAATSNTKLTYAGWWQIASIPDADHFLINFTHSSSYSPSVADVNTYITATTKTDIPVLLGTDGNLGELNGNYTDGGALVVFNAVRRLALAVNSSMRMTDTTISGQTTYTPWLMAQAGNDFQPGQILIRQPQAADTTPEIVLPTYSLTSLRQFVNQIVRSGGAAVSASTRVYPSRILASYPNYPEIFGSPTIVDDSQSFSAVDVNPADGQEITSVVPFFGEAAFGAAQQSGVVVVFKENSIYLVDLEAKRAQASGNTNITTVVQKLETQGLGCTAPYSVAPTRNGIIFANESGIYMLGRNLQIEYLGRPMERLWLGSVNRSLLSIAQGHHYAVGRQYKLGLPIGSTSTTTSEAYVYDHTPELYQRPGAWSRFGEHAATGWCNLAQDAYMASATGRVMSVRRQGDITDYADDGNGIEFQATLRPLHMGDPGIRKTVAHAIAYYRTSATSEGTTLEIATDLNSSYETSTSYQIVAISPNDGLSDSAGKKVTGIRHSFPTRRATHFQLRITNSSYQEPLELVGVTMRVSGATEKGIRQAAQAPR